MSNTQKRLPMWTLAAWALSTVFASPAAWAAAGDPLGPEMRVDSGAGSGVGQISGVARDGVGDVVVVWERTGSAAPGVYARLYAPGGTPKGAEFAVPLADGYPAVAMDSAGDFVVTSSSFNTQKLTYSIQAQRYHASGAPNGAAIAVASYAKLGEFVDIAPAPVAMDAGGDFVVVWNQATATELGAESSLVDLSVNTNAIHARRYAASGTAKGAAFLVAADLPDVAPLSGPLQSSLPVVAVDADGALVSAWINFKLESNTVEFKRYDLNGKAQDLVQHANTSSMKLPSNVAVGSDAAGNFTIAWAELDGVPGTPDYIWARRYSSSGAALGSTFALGTSSSAVFQSPAIGMQPDGDFVVAWGQLGQVDGSALIEAQRCSSGGVLQGTNFQVNSIAPGYQRQPGVAMDGYGDFAVVWAQGAELGNGYDGVYLRLYSGQ